MTQALSNAALFQPIELGPLSLRNRIVMAPMTRTFSPGNVPNDLNVAYYERRAENEVGLIITEGTCIGHKAANGYARVPFIYGEEALAGWKKVVDAVHAKGGKIAPQLWHVGSIRKEGVEPDVSVPGYSPSGLVRPGKEGGIAMTKQDIDDVVEAFAQAAADSQRIGFDAIEVHGAHGYLVDQFFWEGTNQREDEYGGDLVARTRFACEIVSAIRERVGPDFPIIFRFSQWKQQDYSARLANTPEELDAFLKPLVNAGVDIFHCSTRRFWEPEFEGSDLNLAGWTKKLTGKPVITVGSVGLTASFIDEEKHDMVDASGVATASFTELEQRMNNDEFELVGIGRALLQDPEWVIKIREGRYDELEDYSKQSLMQLV
ncbi:NADH:flavin oxidoreductase [Thalassolituus oleivorans]|uniref:Oxidoreductase, FAD/FMN-binding superfamily n=1 Tax=Thalassolituus oleivorans MIL-1 TaxID=1298593 RepID=M5DPK4_9GAMM|nr:NADH:flavin oxidoreductase [Thalassolituus oleivorans]APR67812.1 12-oxophytodienoate reductase [Thalassolituus oleivorans]MCA6127136.1 1,2-oxophytodienoate reductase [Thalassolituus oleivorans 4BN06-13]MDF1639864.1 NADH:flavin oxidoreductase [Thalassolituus oleivorans]CCU71423.1 oxidoreductase, FAD/FMN-binding superfamily [Thalassolituus oleivorans MIL-1]